MRDAAYMNRRYVQNSLRAFLEGEQSLNWIVGIIRESGLNGSDLNTIFERYKGYGDAKRYGLALQEVTERGWL